MVPKIAPKHKLMTVINPSNLTNPIFSLLEVSRQMYTLEVEIMTIMKNIKANLIILRHPFLHKHLGYLSILSRRIDPLVQFLPR